MSNNTFLQVMQFFGLAPIFSAPKSNNPQQDAAQQDMSRYFSPSLKRPLQLQVSNNSEAITYSYSNEHGGRIDFEYKKSSF